jgi:hypothetical protein
MMGHGFRIFRVKYLNMDLKGTIRVLHQNKHCIDSRPRPRSEVHACVNVVWHKYAKVIGAVHLSAGPRTPHESLVQHLSPRGSIAFEPQSLPFFGLCHVRKARLIRKGARLKSSSWCNPPSFRTPECSTSAPCDIDNPISLVCFLSPAKENARYRADSTAISLLDQ